MDFMTDGYRRVAVPCRERPGLCGLVASDLRAKAVWYCGRADARAMLGALAADGTLCTILYRVVGMLRRWHLGFLGALLYKLNVFLTGAVIGRGARFGPGLVILHSVGLVVNTSVGGGCNVVLEGGATIGAEKGRSPVLGDRVFVGSGARVIGGIRLGSDVRVGANAVVLKDVPDGATAVGVPARIIERREDA